MTKEICEDISHIKDYFFACEKCYQDREKHLGCEFCKNQEEFCIKCLKPVNKDKLKKEIIDYAIKDYESEGYDLHIYNKLVDELRKGFWGDGE